MPYIYEPRENFRVCFDSKVDQSFSLFDLVKLLSFVVGKRIIKINKNPK